MVSGEAGRFVSGVGRLVEFYGDGYFFRAKVRTAGDGNLGGGEGRVNLVFCG